MLLLKCLIDGPSSASTNHKKGGKIVDGTHPPLEAAKDKISELFREIIGTSVMGLASVLSGGYTATSGADPTRLQRRGAPRHPPCQARAGTVTRCPGPRGHL